MKSKRLVALIFAAALTVSVLAGCNKNAGPDTALEEEDRRTTWITTEEFVDVCKELGLTRVEPDEIETGGISQDTDTLEEGFYVEGNSRYVRSKANDIEDYLDEFDLDEAIDTKDIESFALAARSSGLSDLEGVSYSYDFDSYSEAEIDGAVAFQMSLNDDYTDSVMDFVEDKLDEYGIDANDLSEEEFYKSDKEGYLRLHIDVAEFLMYAYENRELSGLLNEMFYGMNPFEDLEGEVAGDVAFSIEINSQNMFVIAAFAVNRNAEEIDNFTDSFNAMANPMDVAANSKAAECYADAMVRKLKEMVEGARAVAESIIGDSGELEAIGSDFEEIFG